jgi:hypothetical protein
MGREHRESSNRSNAMHALSTGPNRANHNPLQMALHTGAFTKMRILTALRGENADLDAPALVSPRFSLSSFLQRDPPHCATEAPA